MQSRAANLPADGTRGAVGRAVPVGRCWGPQGLSAVMGNVNAPQLWWRGVETQAKPSAVETQGERKRMALLDYPIPDLDNTLQEAGRILQLTLSADRYPEFKNTLAQQREVLHKAQQKLGASALGRENWVTEQFKSRLLYCFDPLPTSTALPAVLPTSRANRECTQLERAAALLWAVAKLYSEPMLVEGNEPTERTQQSEVFAACRIPGKEQDEIKVYPNSLHALIISAAGVFPVNILWRASTGGPMSALPFPDIYNQVAQVMNQPTAEKQNHPSAICSLSALERKSWAVLREEILGRGGDSATSLELMESAVLALSLEDCNPPTGLADTLNAVRLGGRDRPCLRYYDKVLNLVVFTDSTAGMVFEHKHKNLIKATKSGQGVGPHIAALRWSIPSDNPLRKFLDPFGCPSIYLTGKDMMEGVECAVGNVYATDQLAVTYLGRRDKVRMVLSGKGSFAVVLEKLKESLEVNLKLVMLLAVRYAIACQMGALECLLQQGQAGQLNGEIFHSPGRQKPCKGTNNTNTASDRSPDYTLVIHGGAGEEIMLNTKVVGVIEFALQTALTLGNQVLHQGGSSLDAVQRSVEALEDCFLFNAGKGSVFNKDSKNEMEATIVDGYKMKSGSVACLKSVKNPIKAARSVMDKSSHSLIVGDGAEEFLQSLGNTEKPMGPEYFYTDVRHKELIMKLSGDKNSKNNHPQTVGAVALDHWCRLAAATSTGGLVGKLKGRVGDTAVVGAGIYADDKLAVTCSGDGDVFLRHTVAHKVASLYHHKGYSLRRACREVMTENLRGSCAGIIAVDAKGDAVIETNAGVFFVASMTAGISRVEVFRPMRTFSHVIWETDELVTYLHSNPWTPGATILTRKTLSGPSSIFQLAVPDFLSMLQGARIVSNLLCERLGVQRCALVFYPKPDHPAQIRLLPLHGLDPTWCPQLSEDEEFYAYDPGYCSSKSGPRWNDEILDGVQGKIRNKLPTPNAPPCNDFFGDPSDDGLFSRIVRGEEKQWRVWEDSEHVAFLTPYPNTPGLTVLVPRKPLSSDIFRLQEADYNALILAAYKVAHLLEEGMKSRGVALIFEGFEIDYAHAKLIPLVPLPENTICGELKLEYFQSYPGYVSSLDGPTGSSEALEKIHSKITHCQPPRSWEDPQTHSTLAIKSQWYCNLFQIQNTLFHSTVEYFHNTCQYSYALTPLTTDTISSPMGLGSDSEPVFVNMLGQGIYLADSMQFVLEYFLRFQKNLPGTYYVSPSFRGEDPDATHLNQFYHVECELLGDMNNAIHIAEGYLAHVTNAMLKKHSNILLSTAGTLTHVTDMLSKLDGKTPLPRVTLDEAIPMMPSADCLEWVQDGQPQFGRKLTRKGEKVLIEKYGGAVWLTEMDHLGVPFYQAYVEGTGQCKAKAADLLLGLGETVGLGERHSTPEMVQEALRHHAVPEESYRWYINMREVIPLLTSGWGMGTERYLCWLLQHDDVRDIHIIPRMKARKYMP
ncbi:uncharacterized protein si:ch211-256m1.8 [Lampris incognitus]|uniref:uncharacterized protein si:ch211-256m1.8 n=1 Tax=Lampris incognitus TaxID=2546036 RepID=UPI0024B4EC84|nr:uncharacterized protein si:ch211-256m1.8 [Lampris incognitus]